MAIDYSKILAQREALESASLGPLSGWSHDADGNLILFAPNEQIARELSEAYPGARVVVSQPLPTGGNPPNRKGRPRGLDGR